MSIHDLLHPMRGEGYQLWSGIGGDLGWLRLMWHPHRVHGHPVCRRHHPDGRKIVADQPG